MTSKPFIQITTSAADFQFPLEYVDDDGNHVIQRTIATFPDAQPASGQPTEDNYLPSKMFSLIPPLGVGLKYGHDPHRVWDAAADTRFASGIYPARLSTTPTIPAECAAVQFKVFFHAMGQLFMGGVGTGTAETADEALVYWDGTNWADTTCKDDIGAGTGTMIVSSGCDHKGRAYISLRGTWTSDGASNTIFIARSDVGSTGVWSFYSTGASANPIAGKPYGLVSNGTTMYVVDYAAGSAAVKSSADDGANWPNTHATILTSRAPVDGNAAALFNDGTTSPTLDYWLGTAEGLYRVDVSANTFSREVTFQHPESAYTGQVLLTPLGLIFTDGPVVYVGNWNGGQFVYEAITDTLPAVPSAKQGDITAIAYDNILNEVACFKGGTSASSKSSLYVYSFVTKLWYCLEQQTTANKAMFAAVYSTETAGISKLHRSRDHVSTANHSSPTYLDYISEDPDAQASATFVQNSTNSIIRTSRFDGFAPSVLKGFYKQRIRADGLTATEYLSLKYATNGGSLGSAQTVASGSVASVWTDGSTTAVGSDAYDIDAEITMVIDAGTPTAIPRIRSITWAYDPVGLKDDNTPVRSFTFRISLDPDDYSPNMDVESGKDARDRLETILASRSLVKLAFGQDFPVGSEVKVKMQPYEGRRTVGNVQDQVDLPQDGGGSVLVTFKEVI